MYENQSRRDFLKAAALAGAAAPFSGRLIAAEPGKLEKSPNEKLNLGVIGVAARGGANLNGVSSENIVALCDIDAGRLADAAKAHPNAEKYTDFRKVLDRSDLDGLVVSTPDFMHALPVCQALRQGLAVYCEKPLTYDIYEARLIRKLAAENNCVTQMGNQIHAGSNYRRVVELVQQGAIGPVRRVHVFMPTVEHFVVGERVSESMPPEVVDYKQWIGPAPFRPFHTSHFHFNWRYWYDFGGGQLADFWCHYSDLAFWALGLQYPTTVKAQGTKGHDGENDVPRSMQVDYQFPARGDQPPVHFTWYHGDYVPEWTGEYGRKSGVLFEGDKGKLISDYSTRQVFLGDGSEPAAVENTVPDSIGHHAEWIAAVKGQGTTSSPFEYGGTLTESAHLGNISYRLGEKEITWDAENLKVKDTPEADDLVHREYQNDYSLEA